MDEVLMLVKVVIEAALKMLGLRLVRWQSEEMTSLRDKPE